MLIRPKARFEKRVALITTKIAIAAFAMALSASAQTTPNSTLGEQIVADLAQAKASATPAEWLKAHPAEKLEMFNGAVFANDTQQWCARTVVKHAPVAGHAWTRAVYFYDPEPPADDALPALEASKKEILETTCQLGLIWIEIPETDAAAGTKLAQEIETVLQLRYGVGAVPTFPGGFGSAGWIEVRQWQSGDAVLTVAYDYFGKKGTRVLVRLAFPNSDAIHDNKREMQVDFAAWKDNLELRIRQVKQAGLSADTTSEMTALLEGPDYYAEKNLPSGDQIAKALRDWLAEAKTRPPEQQAIALLVADGVMEFMAGAGRPDDPTIGQLKALGAEYLHDELAGGDTYRHSFLKQAKAIAPPGPAADEVLLLEMEHGFDLSGGMCEAGAEEFIQVIEKGESLLAVARSLPASTLASLHFMVGDAYATIVWLAQNSNDEYHDPKQYQPQEASAREKALEHYRAAFKLEHGTARAEKEWKEAWRLAIGLPPTTERYFCVYD